MCVCVCVCEREREREREREYMCVFISVCGDCRMCAQILMYACVLERAFALILNYHCIVLISFVVGNSRGMVFPWWMP